MYGCDKKILGVHSQLFVPYKKNQKTMKAIDSSTSLRIFLNNTAYNQVDPKANTRLPFFTTSMAFGCATSEFITSEYFDFDHPEVHLYSQNENVEQPREKKSASKISFESREFPTKLGTYLFRLYQDPNSPLYHGFSMMHYNTMKSKFSDGTQKSAISQYIYSNDLIKDTDPDYKLLFEETFRDEVVLKKCHCKPEKD